MSSSFAARILGDLRKKESPAPSRIARFFKATVWEGDTLPKWVLATLRVAIVAICMVGLFDGNHPPAKAQSLSFAKTPEDARQDSGIAELRRRVTTVEAQQISHEAQIQALADENATRAGEEHMFFIIVGLMTSGSLILQIKLKKS